MNKKLMNLKAVIALVTVWTILFTPLSPIIQSASGQTKKSTREYVPSAKPGTAAYYRNPKVRGEILDFMRKNKLTVGKPSELKIGGNPQVDKLLGETIADPQEDEQDILVNDILTETGKEFIELETVSRSGRLYVYRINRDYKDINGNLVTVRRIKETKTIVMTLNCGNVTWEVGAGYKPITPDPVNECPNFDPNPTPTANRNEKGEIVSYTYDFKCGQPVTVEVKVKEVCPECKPGLYKPVLFNRGRGSEEANVSNIASMKELKNSPSFTVKDALIQHFGEEMSGSKKQWEVVLTEMERFQAGIAELKLKYLYLEIDPCATALGTNNILFHAIADDDQPSNVKKRKWGKILKWIIPIAAAVAIFLIVKGGGKTLVKPLPPIRITPPD